jgi:L-amino acid N-acyltransferase YncA
VPVTIRPYRQDDVERVTALYNRHPDNPNPVAGGITAEEFAAELADRRTAAFFVADDGDELVGTFGLFEVTGRRCARSDELIADMFFIAPSHRNGMLTGQLFAKASTWMFEQYLMVMRLTVNPANKAAFKLYRKVGCVSVGEPVPGEDGNVELFNYIPLVIRTTLPGLGEEGRAALRSMTSFACVTDDRGQDLRNDVVEVDGVRTVPYRLVLNDMVLAATVDVDAGTLLTATLTTGDGRTRHLPITPRPDDGARPDPTTYRFGGDALRCEVDGPDGTVRLLAPGHLGPVLTSTWPTCHPGRVPGWRDGFPLDLRVEEIADGVRITERHEDVDLVGTVTLVDGRLRQDFRSTAPIGRVFHTIGLRQASLRVVDPVAGDTGQQPAGLGLAVRDSSEIVAAAHRPAPGSELFWAAPDGTVEIRVPVGPRTGLVHSNLLDRRADADGTSLRLDTHVRVGARRPVVPPSPADAGGAPHQLRMIPAAGGITSWANGRTRVLRSPYPHRRALAYNPNWSAGMWVTAEHGRTDRATGLGWGVATREVWEAKHPLGLHAPDLGIGWEVSAPDGPGPLTAEVHHAGPDGEAVLWLTPRTSRGGRVVVPAPRGTWELVADGLWQRWTAWAAVELADGRWLSCRPGTGASPDAEIVVRSTAAGLLLGCVTPAGPSGRWQFDLLDAPPTVR